MDGFHYSGIGGEVTQFDQVMGSLDLPPGHYIVFASGHVAIGSSYQSDAALAYRVALRLAGEENELIAGLRYAWDDPGSRIESFALNLAAELTAPATVQLAALNAPETASANLYVLYPRISAIQLDNVTISAEEPPAEPYGYWYEAAASVGLSSGALRAMKERRPVK